MLWNSEKNQVPGIAMALFVIFGGANLVILSVKSLEAFADTYNPGYFLIKLALWLLAGLILMQTAVDVALPRAIDPGVREVARLMAPRIIGVVMRSGCVA